MSGRPVTDMIATILVAAVMSLYPINGDTYPLPSYQQDPQLFPGGNLSPAIDVQHVSNPSTLVEFGSLLLSSGLEGSPLLIVGALMWFYTRWVQGKPLFKSGP